MEAKQLTAETLAVPQPTRKPYSAPSLEEYGDVRDLTLGGSAKGLADSLNGKKVF